MTNLNEITYVDWQLKLNTIGGVAEGADDINHCIAIILLTRKDTHKAKLYQNNLSIRTYQPDPKNTTAGRDKFWNMFY